MICVRCLRDLMSSETHWNIGKHGGLPFIDLSFVKSDVTLYSVLFNFFDCTSMMQSICKIHNCRMIPKTMTWNRSGSSLLLRVESLPHLPAVTVFEPGIREKRKERGHMVKYKGAETYSYVHDLSFEDLVKARTQKMMPVFDDPRQRRIRASL
jgi:hypothetical protein